MSRSSKDPVTRIVHARAVQQKTYAYHAHDPREVLTVLDSTTEGLTTTVAWKRLAAAGPNQFTRVAASSWWRHLIAQVTSPLAIVLIITFFVTVGIGEYIDAGVIGVALTLAVLVGLFQEGKASTAFATLATSQARVTTVMRDGKLQQIDVRGLVPGDVVVLQSGTYVPADMRLLYSKELQVNESALTGEWAAVTKKVSPVAVGTPLAERSSMVYMGTFVTRGYARGVVVATGAVTEVGQVADELATAEDPKTPLQLEMAALSRLMLYGITALTILIFLVGIVRGHSVHEMLLMAIAIAVASIPEGLPAAVTIVLAIGMTALLKRGGLVRNLLAAETLGATTYVVTDKTGTLTEGTMALAGVLIDGVSYVPRSSFGPLQELVTLCNTALVATASYTDAGEHGGHTVRGESAEVAILETARALGLRETATSTLRTKRIDYVPFSSENRYAAGLVALDDVYRLCVNGAPRLLIDHAAQYSVGGRATKLSPAVRAEIVSLVGELSQQGKRLIAVATKTVSYDDIPETDQHLLDGLTLEGILVLDDPVRPHISADIDGVQAAGARVILVTGDNPQTAHAVAIAAGICTADDPVLTGHDLEILTDEELLIALREIPVFARVLPQQKLRIVSVLQQHGEIVAMTGDGVNDAPALRRAHIGVAIGAGTEVAKEASDLVLVNNSFATIYAAIEEGRRVMSNIRKIVAYLLSTSLTEVVLITLALVLATPLPILPAQILWANIIEEGFMSVAFAFEESERGSMRQAPHDLHEEGILSPALLWFLGCSVTVLAAITGALYWYTLVDLELPITTIRSIMFVAISVDSLFIAVSFRSLSTPVWRIPFFTNRFFLGSFALSVVALLLPLTVPFFARVLSYTPLSLPLIVLPIATSLLALFVVELGKAVFLSTKT